MNIKNVRVGNYVDLYGSVATVEHFDLNVTAPKGLAVCKGEPIPLTIDMLEKNGLIEGVAISNLPIFCAVIKVDYLKFTGTFEVYIDGENMRSLEYVHELQNWWYWTTGKELNLKL